eukprot:m.5608 g.5608  ORF g.5608 m.5608 type:complete len:461 (-) comp2528_c0_seq2:2995-4377(-)
MDPQEIPPPGSQLCFWREYGIVVLFAVACLSRRAALGAGVALALVLAYQPLLWQYGAAAIGAGIAFLFNSRCTRYLGLALCAVSAGLVFLAPPYPLLVPPSGPFAPAHTRLPIYEHGELSRGFYVHAFFPVEKTAVKGLDRPILVQPWAIVEGMGDLFAFIYSHLRNFRAYYYDAEDLRGEIAALRNRPPIIYSHGLSGHPLVYTINPVELASHGFVVFSITHTDGSASYSQQPVRGGEDVNVPFNSSMAFNFEIANAGLNHRVDEVAVLAKVIAAGNAGQGSLAGWVKGILDLDRLGMYGHSYGGSTAIYSVEKVPAIRVTVPLDPWDYPLPPDMKGRKDVPLLTPFSQNFFDFKPILENIFKRLPLFAPSSDIFYVKGTSHNFYSDYIFYTWPGLLGGTSWTNLRDNRPVTERLAVAYFLKHLDIDPKPWEEALASLPDSIVYGKENMGLPWPPKPSA